VAKTGWLIETRVIHMVQLLPSALRSRPAKGARRQPVPAVT
jgi:hypothetical protein